MGHRICDTVLDFCDPDQVKVKAVLEELEIMVPENGGGDSEDGSDGESAPDSDYSDDGAGDGNKKKKLKAGKKKGKKDK